MKTTKRFEQAVIKLYNAFHKGELDAWDCMACAVGNICNNNPSWASFYNGVYLYKSMPCEEPEVSKFPDKDLNKVIIESGYSAYQLAKIETIFLKGMPTLDKETKDQQFNGLCAVVEYLCELDNIPNIMDYTSLFETEENAPKKELTEVFI